MCLYRFAILAVMLVLQPIGSDHGKRRAPFEQAGAGGVSEVVKPRLDTGLPLGGFPGTLDFPGRPLSGGSLISRAGPERTASGEP